MVYAEQKIELFQIVVNADEKLTGLLRELADHYNQGSPKLSDKEIAEFEKTRNDFFASGEKGYTVEEAHTMIRNRLKK